MINLLPPEVKQSYRYAERNVGLLRWLVAGLVILAGVGLIGAYGWLSTRQAIGSNNQHVASLTSTLKEAKLDETNKRVSDISSSLKLAENVLAQEILFSKLLKQMATALPDGTYLSGLNISEVSGGSGLDVSVAATSYNAATQVQVNLEDPDNQIFAKADIQNIGCDTNSDEDSGYPCKVTLRAQFAANNQFLFINQKQVKS
jgi:Tfp pilus assembly protein PilN